jgi:hypothetical protein
MPYVSTPFAYIAHKDGYWCGVASPDLPAKDLRDFLGDFAADGFSIMTVNSREEYEAALASMKSWGKRPKEPAA